MSDPPGPCGCGRSQRWSPPFGEDLEADLRAEYAEDARRDAVAEERG
jgi:hypothetical protein